MKKGMGYTRTLGVGSAPVFQGYGKDIQLVQGGFGLDITDLVAGTILLAGVPFLYDESTRMAKPLPIAVIFENAAANAVNYKVKKGHTLKVGNNFANKSGQAAYAITAINTSNADYDTVTVGTTIGALNAGDLVFGSTDAGANAAAYPVTMKGLLYEETEVEAGTSVSIVRKAVVYAHRVPYSADLEAALPKITYSQSF